MTATEMQTIVTVIGANTYTCEAPVGTATTAASWKVKRTNVTNGITTTSYPVPSGSRYPSAEYRFQASAVVGLTYILVPDFTAPVILMSSPYSQTVLSTSASQVGAITDAEGYSNTFFDIYLGTDDQIIIDSIDVVEGTSTTYDFGFGITAATYIRVTTPVVSFTTTTGVSGGTPKVYGVVKDAAGNTSTVQSITITVT